MYVIQCFVLFCQISLSDRETEKIRFCAFVLKGVFSVSLTQVTFVHFANVRNLFALEEQHFSPQ